MATLTQTLAYILKDFDEARNRYMEMNGGFWATGNEDDRADLVSEWAAPVANRILRTGFFKVEDMYRIYPTVLELYYHEESDNGLEDPIMYHTDARCPSYLGRYPYFKPGSFHLHTSGIDITFEKEDQYRASFLIREFRIDDCDGKTMVEKDDKSTHLFDYMFPTGVSEESLARIAWESIPGSKLIPKNEMFDKEHLGPRKNVCKYEKDDNGRYRTNVTKSGNRYFIKIENEQCGRPWQFRK